MKFFVVLAIVAYSAATSAVKVTPEYSVNVIHHPQGAHSVYNPFVKPTFTDFQSTAPGSSYFG